MTFRQFLFNKGTRFAVIMALCYQVFMLGIYFYGYHAIPGNVNGLSIELYNGDGVPGSELLKGLSRGLPYRISFADSLVEAQQRLNERKTAMIIEVPAGFCEGKTGSMNFYINKSNPQITVMTMQQTAEGLISALNENKSPSPAGTVKSNIVFSNPTPQPMSNQMAPMFLTLALYSGAMIASISIAAVFKSACQNADKWRMFAFFELLGLIISVIAPLVNVGMAALFIHPASILDLKLFAQGALFQFCAFQLASIFSLLLGSYGSLANTPLLMAQVLASGATMSYSIMPLPFKLLANISPIYSNTQICYNILYGGGGTGLHELRLVLVGLAAALIDICIVHFMRLGTAENGKADLDRISEESTLTAAAAAAAAETEMQ
jgi:Predicted membrane protein